MSYKLTDFKNIVVDVDTNIYERIISITLSNVKKLPIVLVNRLETLINKITLEHEQKYNRIIPLESMKLSMYLNIDTLKKDLYLSVFIDCLNEKECITTKESIITTDEDYVVIKEYFLSELNHLLLEQVRKIEECV